MASAEFVFLRGFDLILRLWGKLLLYLALLGGLLVLLHIVVDGLEVSLLERPGRAVGAAAHHTVHRPCSIISGCGRWSTVLMITLAFHSTIPHFGELCALSNFP
jgi:hypothetical protein